MSFEMPPQSVPPDDPQAALHRLRLLRQGIVLGLISFSLLLLLLAFYLISASVQRDIARAEANLGAAQDTLLRMSTPAPETQALMTTLSTTLLLAEQLEAARPPASIPWPAVMAALNSYAPTTITFTKLTQVENRITLTGQAANDIVVVDYERTLGTMPLFANVTLQSLTLLAPTTAATAPPATTVAPGTVTFVIQLELSGQIP
ncbi:MAG: PilN domain-containing protein [Caldilineaceae bacterium]|nr:PilN domain-containing protein [Caldilineaceae bacterium]